MRLEQSYFCALINKVSETIIWHCRNVNTHPCIVWSKRSVPEFCCFQSILYGYYGQTQIWENCCSGRVGRHSGEKRGPSHSVWHSILWLCTDNQTITGPPSFPSRIHNSPNQNILPSMLTMDMLKPAILANSLDCWPLSCLHRGIYVVYSLTYFTSLNMDSLGADMQLQHQQHLDVAL